MGEMRSDIHTSDGVRLDAELCVPDEPTWGAVIAHPHPEYGGSMDTPVVGSLFRGLPRYGAITLRLNFRGVGTSQGNFDSGNAERLDLLAAVTMLSEHLGRDTLGVVMVGYSFGGDVCLCIDHLSISGWWILAPPLAVDNPEGYLAAADARPKRLLIPELDEFNPPDRVIETTRDWTNVSIDTLSGVGHMVPSQDDIVVADAAAFAAGLRD